MFTKMRFFWYFSVSRGISLFLGGLCFCRNWVRLELSGDNRCCGLSSLSSYDMRMTIDEKFRRIATNLDDLVATYMTLVTG